jgi:hypothetical protein
VAAPTPGRFARRDRTRRLIRRRAPKGAARTTGPRRGVRPNGIQDRSPTPAVAVLIEWDRERCSCRTGACSERPRDDRRPRSKRGSAAVRCVRRGSRTDENNLRIKRVGRTGDAGARRFEGR